MTDRRDLPAPVGALVRAVGGASLEDDERASTFARGLALGALVGAAIAGSAIWQRRQGRARQADAAAPDVTPAAEPSEPPARPEPSGSSSRGH